MRQFTYLLILFASLYSSFANAQSHRYRAFGGTGNEEIRDFIPTVDGNFLGVGYIKALGYVHGSLGNKDALVVKMTPDGDILWAKSYGGDYDEEFYDVVIYQGHYYCIGFTNSWQIAGTTSNSDAFLVKLDFAGEVQWAKHYGEPTVAARYNDAGYNIITSGNNTGVMFVGSTGAGNGADQNIVAFRVLPDGSTGFAKSYDLPDLSGASQSGDFGRAPVLVTNNEYVIAGNVWGGSGNRDPMLLRVNNVGDIVWARRFALPDNLYETLETPIYDQIKNRIITGGIHQRTTGDQDGILFRDIKQADGLQISGSAPRSRSFSINNTDFRRSYLYKKENPANGYYMTMIGATSDDVALDGMDAVVVSLDTALNIQWQRRFGGAKYDYIKRAMAWCSNNDIVGMGGTRSSPGANGYDLFFCRMFSTGLFDDQSTAACILNSTYTPSNINYTNTAITTLVASNLGSNWQKTVTNMTAPINVLPYLLLRMDQCTTGTSSSIQAPEFNSVENSGDISVTNATKLDETEIKWFQNAKSILNFSFKIVDDFEFVYFHTDKPDVLKNGLKLQKTKDLPPGNYTWLYEAMLPNGTIDMKSGQFSVK